MTTRRGSQARSTRGEGSERCAMVVRGRHRGPWCRAPRSLLLLPLEAPKACAAKTAARQVCRRAKCRRDKYRRAKYRRAKYRRDKYSRRRCPER